jgi:hypothetical protein
LHQGLEIGGGKGEMHGFVNLYGPRGWWK